MLREDSGPKMVVSDFDAFIHGCTLRGTQNFVNIDPMSANKSLRSRTGHKTWAKVTKNNGWLNIPSGPSYKVTQKRKMSLQGPTNNRLRCNNQLTSALLVSCVQRTRLPLPFMGNALSHILIRCGQTWNSTLFFLWSCKNHAK